MQPSFTIGGFRLDNAVMKHTLENWVDLSRWYAKNHRGDAFGICYRSNPSPGTYSLRQRERIRAQLYNVITYRIRLTMPSGKLRGPDLENNTGLNSPWGHGAGRFPRLKE